jgi:hypothetical protein
LSAGGTLEDEALSDNEVLAALRRSITDAVALAVDRRYRGLLKA